MFSNFSFFPALSLNYVFGATPSHILTSTTALPFWSPKRRFLVATRHSSVHALTEITEFVGKLATRLEIHDLHLSTSFLSRT